MDVTPSPPYWENKKTKLNVLPHSFHPFPVSGSAPGRRSKSTAKRASLFTSAATRASDSAGRWLSRRRLSSLPRCCFFRLLTLATLGVRRHERQLDALPLGERGQDADGQAASRAELRHFIPHRGHCLHQTGSVKLYSSCFVLTFAVAFFRRLSLSWAMRTRRRS